MHRRERSVFLAIYLCGISLLGAAQGITLFKLIFEDMTVFSPCENYPDNYITEVFDYSKLHIEYVEDNNLKVNGTVVIVKELPKTPPIKFTAQVYKKVRGQWKDSIYNLKRDDFCRAFFSPLEPWYNYTRVLPVEYRTCEISKGETYVDFVVDVKIPIPDRNAGGEYKFVAKFMQGTRFNCANIFFTAERLYD